MFDAITIKSNESEDLAISPSFLAECLLFYNSVNFLAHKDSFKDLFKLCGIDGIIELIKMKRLNLYIKKDIIGTTRFPGNRESYDVLNTHDTKFDKESYIVAQLEQLYEPVKIRHHLNELMDLISVQEYDDSIIEEINEDLKNQNFLTEALVETIKYWYPNANLRNTEINARYFQVGEWGPFKSHLFETNIDLSQYPQISPSSIILNIAEARGNIHLAGLFNSEIADRTIYANIVRLKVNSLIQKQSNSLNNISSFNEYILQDYKPLGDVILNKEKSFSEFIDLLHKSDKFKSWLKDVDCDSKLIAEYYKAVTKDSWVESLPSKAVRFYIFTGAGLILDAAFAGGLGTAIGIALTAGDSFLIEKLLKKWKPNQFIDEPLKNFLGKK